jgi:ribosomal protein S18 acetylase RimI-like enzyme
MNDEYIIRNAVAADADFIADAIIAAEKGETRRLSLGTLFNLPEAEIKKLLIQCLDEESSGCEFSLNSFLITEHAGEPIAAMAGWIENFETNIASRTIKTNLMRFVFPKESILNAYSKSDIIKDLLIEREKNTLQVEYVYTSNEYRGKGLAGNLIDEHIALSLVRCPGLIKAQVQVFKNNGSAIKLYERSGFKPARLFVSSNKEILQYLPYHEKLLMEKMIK